MAIDPGESRTPSLQACAAHLKHLADTLPDSAVGRISAELDLVAQEAMRVVERTRHEQAAAQIAAMTEQAIQQLLEQVGVIKQLLESTATAILGEDGGVDSADWGNEGQLMFVSSWESGAWVYSGRPIHGSQ